MSSENEQSYPLTVDGQPVGRDLGSWSPPERPPWETLTGRSVTLEPLQPTVHGPRLFEAFKDAPDSLWTYLPWGPYRDPADMIAMFVEVGGYPDWMTWAVTVDGEAVGFCSYLRINPTAGSIEIGGINFLPKLQQTTASTEALSMLIERSFSLGYRRCEWKCDHLNAPSRRAAERLGFTFEGIFAKATHYKGRSRDTAWFAITDDEWDAIGSTHREWLDAGNFDGHGAQRVRLNTQPPPRSADLKIQPIG